MAEKTDEPNNDVVISTPKIEEKTPSPNMDVKTTTPNMDVKTYTLKLPMEMDRETLIKALTKSNEHLQSPLCRLATYLFSLPGAEITIAPSATGEPSVTLSIFKDMGTESFLEIGVKARTTIHSSPISEAKYSQLEFQADTSAQVKSDYITGDQLAQRFVNRLERIVKRHYQK